MFCALHNLNLNKSWRQHPTRHQLYGHLPPITKTVQVRRTRHAGHCWKSRDELTSDVFLWTPTYGRAKAGRPARTYIQQLCEDTGCSPEDLLEAMNDREKWRERVRDIRVLHTHDTDTWNRHSHIGTQNIHNVHNAHIDNIRILKHKKHLRLLRSGTKLFITFELKGFSTKGEWYTIFLCWLFHLPPPRAPPAARPRRAPKVNLLLRTLKLNSLTFLKSLKSSAYASGVWRHSHLLVSFPIFYFHICEWRILSAREHLRWCLHLTNPCTKRKVLSLTKPKGKIYKTKSLGHYITYVAKISFLDNLYWLLILEKYLNSKVGDLSRGWPEGSHFNSYYTEVLGRALLHSQDCSSLSSILIL